MNNQLLSLFLQYPNISTDTRQTLSDSIFFCLKGEHFDANQFATQALALGAKYVVSDDIANQHLPNVIMVEDTLVALQQLAQQYREILSIPVIGVTGTNGKTTTKELIYSVLAKKYILFATQGNLNNHIGVPLTILRIRPEHKIAIVEMGANHPDELDILCRIAQPTLGLITNIGMAHWEGFGSLNNIIRTKTQLYRTVMQNNGILFVNKEDEILKPLVKGYEEVMYYSATQLLPHTISGQVIDMNPYLKIRLFKKEVITQLTGNYNLNNILAAATVGKAFNVPEKDIRAAIAEYIPQNQRSQIIHKETLTIIADYYNANPSSMKAALLNFAELKAESKTAILGEMLELGEESANEHLTIVLLCQELEIPTLLIGSQFQLVTNFADNAFAETAQLNEYLKKHPLANQTILLKGSRGVHLEECELVK